MISACSLFSGGSTATLKLPQAVLETTGEDDAVQIFTVSEDPYVYSLHLPKVSNPIFFIVLKECGLGEKITELSTTRALFSGFKNLRILHQEKIELEEQLLLRTRAQASLTEHPVQLESFSRRMDSCVQDHVFWIDESGDRAKIFDASSQVFLRIIRTTLDMS
jgi:hypothetical protein